MEYSRGKRKHINEARTVLDSKEHSERIEAIQRLKDTLPFYDIRSRRDTNDHIHSKYSFSSYYPAKVAYLAIKAGLATADFVDHECCAGAGEFIEAARILGLPVSNGLEVRVIMRDTALGNLRLNNPIRSGIPMLCYRDCPITGWNISMYSSPRTGRSVMPGRKGWRAGSGRSCRNTGSIIHSKETFCPSANMGTEAPSLNGTCNIHWRSNLLRCWDRFNWRPAF
jgi:hypothetical protein